MRVLKIFETAENASPALTIREPANSGVSLMAIEGQGGESKWQLGLERHEPEPLELAHAVAAPEEPEHDLSAERLERPVFVLTVEHLWYFLIATWAIATRLLALDRRPLTPAEAARALFDLDLAQNGPAVFSHLSPPYALPMHLVDAWMFNAIGANDAVARMGFALSGVLLVVIAFTLRRQVGRAGALALAALLAISPSVTYFSRFAVSPIPALALTLVAIRLFFALAKRATILRALALAVVAGLALAADPISYVTSTIFVIAALVFVVWNAIFDDTYFERVRYWWVRHGVAVAISAIIGGAIWLYLDTGFWSQGIAAALRAKFTANLRGAGSPGYSAGIDFYLPISTLYEFLPALLGIVGALLFLTLRLRSRFAGWCFIWTVASRAFYLWTPARAPGLATVMLVPMAMMGALAVDYIHRSSAWRIVRYPLGLLAALTMYVGLMVNFGFDVPDASEAPWSRHALLYWSEPVTTAQTRTEAGQLVSIARRADSLHPSGILRGDVPALKWYLRDVPAVPQAGGVAAVVVTDAASRQAALAAGVQTTSFELQDQWTPRLRDASPAELLRYVLTHRAWSPLVTQEATILWSAAALAPSPIPTPVPTASATALPPQTPTVTPSETPTATPAPSPSPGKQQAGAMPPSPSPTSSPSATATRTPVVSPTVLPSPSVTASPSPSASATAAATVTATAVPSIAPTQGIATFTASASPVVTMTAKPGAIQTPEVSPTPTAPAFPENTPTANGR